MLVQGAPAAYSQPQIYTEPAYSRLGFLHNPAPKPAKAQQRRKALQTLVNRRHASAAEENEAACAAAALRRSLLCSRALEALQAAVAAAQAAALKAGQQRQKWEYLSFAACWEAWRGAAAARRRMAALVVEATALRKATLLARSLAALQRHVDCRRAKGRGAATADSFRCFCLLVHALDGWRGAMDCRQHKRLLLENALLHWAARLCRKALAAWRAHTHKQLHRRHQLKVAAGHCRSRLLGAAFSAWLETWRRLRDRRDAAAAAIRSALYGGKQQLAGMCLLGWRRYAARQAQLRDSTHLADRLRRFGLLTAAWRGWHLWCGWQLHLRCLHARMESLQPRLLLRCALRRWQAGVQAAQADDGAMCYRAVQLPRAFGAWRLRAQRSQELRLQGECCERVLACRRRRAALQAWQGWAEGERGARAKLLQAQAWWAARTQQAALLEWSSAAKLRAARRERVQQAAVHWAAVLRRAALHRWRRVVGLRHAGSCWRQLSLLRRAFCGWRGQAVAKGRKAERWRLAVRQHYLRQLWAGMEALRLHHQRRAGKRQRLQEARRRYQALLLSHCLAAWSGPFLAAARQQRDRRQLAAGLDSRRRVRHVLAAWHGPFLAAARHRRSKLQAAHSHRATALLHAAWAGWQEWQQRREEKQLCVAEACAQLRPGRLRQVLGAWRAWWQAAAFEREQEAAAEALLCQHTLCRCWAAWQAHVCRRQLKHRRWCAALLCAGRQQARRALANWRATAHTTALLRRLGQPALSQGRGERQSHGEGAAAADASPAGRLAPCTDGGTAAVLAKLRQLRSAAAEATAGAMGSCAAAPAAALEDSAEAVAAPVGSQPQWRAASTANVLMPTKVSVPTAGSSSSAAAAAGGCTVVVHKCTIYSDAGRLGGVALPGNRAPRPAPRRPAAL